MKFNRRLGRGPSAGANRDDGWQSRRTDVGNQVRHFFREGGQFVFKYAPNRRVMNDGIPMNQDIAEGDNTSHARETFKRQGVQFFRLGKRFADRDELPFNARSEECFTLVVGKRLSAGKVFQKVACRQYVMQVLGDFRPHRVVVGWRESNRRSRGW